jgi:hypothetical protein
VHAVGPEIRGEVRLVGECEEFVGKDFVGLLEVEFEYEVV